MDLLRPVWARALTLDMSSFFQREQLALPREKGDISSPRMYIFRNVSNCTFRFSYTDFAVGCVLNRLLKEGLRAVGFHYDIMCHYEKKLWGRLGLLQAPAGPLASTDFDTFVSSVPKFHLAGHTEGCFARYSLNNIHGVGRLDAEGGERCWANLNHAAGSTSEKGPGSRVDSINHVMHQWNWCKITGMGA